MAPDRAALVEEMSALVDALSEYDIANHRGKYAKLRDRSIAALQRARDMIVADDDKILQAMSDIEDRDKRIAELEAKCSALEADARRYRWLRDNPTGYVTEQSAQIDAYVDTHMNKK